MLKFQDRPDKPETFDDDIAASKLAIKNIVDAGACPKSADFTPVWRNHKAALTTAQHDKCGYCELWLSSHPGDVEHYHPKAKVQELPVDKKKWGREGRGVYNVRGRRLKKVSSKGYWWLAYDWDNYLAACNRCNSGWKRNIFQVDESPRTDPDPSTNETPLLLNPFCGEDPADHLEFDSIGQVNSLNDSKYGRSTIDTCGLDRDSLVRARFEKADSAYELLNEYAEAESVEERNRVVKRFIKMGRPEYSFAGMVRAIFKQKLQLSWSDYEEAYLNELL